VFIVTGSATLGTSARQGVVGDVNAVPGGRGGYAVANTDGLGVLASPGRHRLAAVCEYAAELTVTGVADRSGVATTPDEVLDTAAFQVCRCELDGPVVEKRLQYLYGAARADIGPDVAPRPFAGAVSSRGRRNEPES
jgi:hypothetical protein